MKRIATACLALALAAGSAQADLQFTDSSKIVINYVVGTANPPNVVRVLRNIGPSALSFTQFETPVATWENHVPTTGSLASGAQVNITFSFLLTALPIGDYQTAITYFNSANFGDQAIINIELHVIPPAPKLCSTGQASTMIDYVIGDPLPAAQIYTVSNCGAAASTLKWTAAEVPDQPWLTLSSTGGSINGGQPAVNVAATIDPTGLPKGSYSAKIHVENMENASQSFDYFIDVAVSAPAFKPGQVLIGTIDTLATQRKIDFNAVAGMQLKLKVSSPNQDLKPKITIVDENLAPVTTFQFKNSKKGKGKKVKLGASGIYTLFVESDGTTLGDFTITTGAKLPKLAKPRVVKKVKAQAPYIIVQLPLLGIKGGVLNLNVVGLGGTDANMIQQTLLTPTNQTFNLSAYTQNSASSTFYVGVPLSVSGEYTLQLTGFPTPIETVQVQIAPQLTAPTLETLDLDLF